MSSTSVSRGSPIRSADTVPGSVSTSGRPGCPQTLEEQVFVGREHELGVLHALLMQVRTGGARVALLRGVPGIGKTALVRAFLRDHPDHGDARTVGAHLREQRVQHPELVLAPDEHLLRRRPGTHGPVCGGGRSGNGVDRPDR